MRHPQTKAEQTVDNSKRYLAMESDVYEIGRAATAASIILDTFMEEFHGMADRDIPAKDMAKHLDHWRLAVDFMVNHLTVMAHELRKHYSEEREVLP